MLSVKYGHPSGPNHPVVFLHLLRLKVKTHAWWSALYLSSSAPLSLLSPSTSRPMLVSPPETLFLNISLVLTPSSGLCSNVRHPWPPYIMLQILNLLYFLWYPLPYFIFLMAIIALWPCMYLLAYWFSVHLGFPGGSDGKESACDEGYLGSLSGLGRSPGGGAWQSTPVCLPGESPWTEEPGGLQSIRSKRDWHDWVTNT